MGVVKWIKDFEMAAAGLEAFDKTVQQPHIIGEVQDITQMIYWGKDAALWKSTAAERVSRQGETFLL